MIENECIGIIGGDMRMQYLAEIFSDSGHIVKLAGHDFNNTLCSDIILCNDVKNLADTSDIIILGLPAVKHGEINTPLYSGKILTEELIENLNHGSTVYGGKVEKITADEFKNNGIRLIDYCENDMFAWQNAVSSAEGCLKLIMDNISETVCSLPCLIAGYGRIGKKLSDLLKKMDASVTVAARRESALNEASVFGFDTCRISEIGKNISDKRVIINTVPSMIFNEDILNSCKDKLIIDLASMPGGVDFKYAGENGIKVIHALGIPGKYAPVTSAKIIYSVISNSTGG